MTSTIQNTMLYRIRGKGRGSVFSAKRFLDLGGRDAVDKALSRFTEKGYIIRIGRGLYYYPKTSPTLGILAPSITEIAKALADKDKNELQMSGAEAANILGLSEQVPARPLFYTNGHTKSIKIGKGEIEFRHAAPKKMATAGKASGIVFRALDYIGKDNIDDAIIDKLRERLTEKDKSILRKDIDYCPDWMRPIINRITS